MHLISAPARLLTILCILCACVLSIPAALAEDQIQLAVGARGNWETAAAELGQNAGFFRKRGLVLDLLYTQGSGETQQAVISGSAAIGVGLGTDLPYFRDQTIRLIVANADYLQQHPAIVARFIQAYRDSLQWMYAGSDGLKAYAELAHVPEPSAQQVRDVFYPRDNMQVDHVSGLASVMADGVEFKYLAAPL